MSCRTKATEPVEVPASVVFEAVIVARFWPCKESRFLYSLVLWRMKMSHFPVLHGVDFMKNITNVEIMEFFETFYVEILELLVYFYIDFLEYSLKRWINDIQTQGL